MGNVGQMVSTLTLLFLCFFSSNLPAIHHIHHIHHLRFLAPSQHHPHLEHLSTRTMLYLFPRSTSLINAPRSNQQASGREDAQAALSNRMDMYKGDGTFDAIKAAAYAAGRAHQDAQRRGSQINLVDSHNNKTTSLLFRRPSSEQRELEQAREKFKTTREMYYGGVDKK